VRATLTPPSHTPTRTYATPTRICIHTATHLHTHTYTLIHMYAHTHGTHTHTHTHSRHTPLTPHPSTLDHSVPLTRMLTCPRRIIAWHNNGVYLVARLGEITKIPVFSPTLTELELVPTWGDNQNFGYLPNMGSLFIGSMHRVTDRVGSPVLLRVNV
jgi:hypothetical protein